MIRVLNLIAMRLSVLYVILILASFSASMLLPSTREVWEQRNESCYWMDAMLSGVQCGPDVYASSSQELAFNFWLYFLYLPMFVFYSPLFMLWKTILLYAPLIYLGVRLVRFLRQRSS